jgi:hypothetical protein
MCDADPLCVAIQYKVTGNYVASNLCTTLNEDPLSEYHGDDQYAYF